MKKWRAIIQILSVSAVVAAGAIDAGAVTYYVDSSNVSANDSNSGTSTAGPWRTLARVNAQTLQPGDSVLFRAGTTYTGTLTLTSSGTQAQPITIAAYGTGAAPIIRNPGVKWMDAIKVDASWNIVRGFKLQEVHHAGVNIAATRSNNVIEYNEMTNTGIGVILFGPSNIVRHNNAHDLKMVVNTSSNGVPRPCALCDDDWGAAGYWVSAPNNEIGPGNRCVRCVAQSYDYGVDGGFVEIYGDGSGTSVHHNWFQDSAGFYEVSGTAHNVTIAYNVSVNSAYFGGIHSAAAYSNFRVENNTIVETTNTLQYPMIWRVPVAAQFLFRNNIVVVANNVPAILDAPATRANNIYHFTTGTQGQIVRGSTALAPGEQLGNPLFVDQPAFNFRLQANSPAIDRGLYLGYTRDFDQMAVPSGIAPDLGVYEFSGQVSNPPVSNPAPLAPIGLRVF